MVEEVHKSGKGLLSPHYSTASKIVGHTSDYKEVKNSLRLNYVCIKGGP